jgi:hypothetical protein
MSNLTSVLKQLKQEHNRLTSQLDRLNSAISAPERSKRRNYSTPEKAVRCWSGADCSCSTGEMGQSEGPEGCVHRCQKTQNVSIGHRSDSCRSKSTLGEMEKAAKSGVTGEQPPVG